MSDHTHGPAATSAELILDDDDGCAWCIGYRDGYIGEASTAAPTWDPDYQRGLTTGQTDRSDDERVGVR